jgi:hypothetical protein
MKFKVKSVNLRENSMSRLISAPLLTLAVVLATILLFGCSIGKSRSVELAPVKVYSSEKKFPKWTTDIPEEKDYYYFMGTSSDAATFDKGKKEALNDSLSQVVSTIGITVTSTLTVEEQYYADEYTTNISAEILSEGRAKLLDAELKEIYFEQYERSDGTTFFRVWTLLKYSKREIEKEQERLRQILEEKYGEVLSLEAKASGHLKNDRISEAILASISAAVAALRIEDADVLFDRNLTRATELILSIGMQKHGEDQVGYVGETLELPLRLRVYYIQKEGKISLQNVPVKFSYRIPKVKSSGYKNEIYSTVTDQNGYAEMRPDVIYEVSDRNRVEARIDYSPIVSQLDSVPPEFRSRVESLKKVIQTKKTVFVFRTDTRGRKIKTGLYFLQFDADGKSFPNNITAATIYEALVDKKFSVASLDIDPATLGQSSGKELVSLLMASAPTGT